MKDFKLKCSIAGFGGTNCIISISKTHNWTTCTITGNEFAIERSAEETLTVHQQLIDDDGNVSVRQRVFEKRKGKTNTPITTPQQHPITMTHS